MRTSTVHGDSPICAVNTSSIACAAPSPSNTEPKASAARMIHMNMQEMRRVLRTEFSSTSRVMRRLTTAARKAASAPMADDSTSEVEPMTKGTIITA